MRHSSSLIIILLFTIGSFGQKAAAVEADTFQLADKFSFKTIIIRSDSTYSLREGGCTSSRLSMGFWTKNNDIFFLTALHETSVSATTELLRDPNRQDSIVTFRVQDCYGNPIPDYYINILDKDLQVDTFSVCDTKTNQSGILRVSKNNSRFFTTESDELNREDDEGNFSDIIYRPIVDNASSITILLSFPKSTIQKSEDNQYKFLSRKFRRSSQYLEDLMTGVKYVLK